MKFDVDYNKVLSTEDKQNEFEQMILSEYANLWPDVRIKSGTIEEGKNTYRILESHHKKTCLQGFATRFSHDMAHLHNMWILLIPLLYRILCLWSWRGILLSVCASNLPLDVYHILWTMYAGVLKCHIWFPHGKIADLYFFSCPGLLCPFYYAPLFKKFRTKSC